MSPFIQLPDRVIHYEERGSGHPLLFIHGWGMSCSVWNRTAENLARSFRVLTMDLRGHGASSPTATYLLSDFVDDVTKLVEILDLKDLVLVGWSMGGQIAMASIGALANRLAGLILVASTPKFTACADFQWGLPMAEARGMTIRLRRSPRRAMEDFITNMFTGDDENLKGPEGRKAMADELGSIYDEKILLQALDTLIATDLRAALPHMDLPVLILHGRNDRICLSEASEFMFALIPGAVLRLLLNAGHAPFLTRSDEFNAHVGQFLKEIHERD